MQRCIDFIESLQKDIILKYRSSSILVIICKILGKLWPFFDSVAFRDRSDYKDHCFFSFLYKMVRALSRRHIQFSEFLLNFYVFDTQPTARPRSACVSAIKLNAQVDLCLHCAPENNRSSFFINVFVYFLTEKTNGEMCSTESECLVTDAICNAGVCDCPQNKYLQGTSCQNSMYNSS